MKNPANVKKSRQGMALPITLVVLLVAGAMVAVSFVFIENMRTTSVMKTDDEFLTNAAIDGIERGKSWIYNQMDADEPPLLLAEGAINSLSSDFKELLVASGDVAPNPTLQFAVGDAQVEVRIFDLGYDFGESLEFTEGMPPMLYKGAEGASLKAGQSYGSSNVGEGNPGAGEPAAQILRAYLVRSSVKREGPDGVEGLSKHIEQALFVKP